MKLPNTEFARIVHDTGFLWLAKAAQARGPDIRLAGGIVCEPAPHAICALNLTWYN